MPKFKEIQPIESNAIFAAAKERDDGKYEESTVDELPGIIFQTITTTYEETYRGRVKKVAADKTRVRMIRIATGSILDDSMSGLTDNAMEKYTEKVIREQMVLEKLLKPKGRKAP